MLPGAQVEALLDGVILVDLRRSGKVASSHLPNSFPSTLYLR